MKNKKGQMAIIYFFIILLVVLILGFIGSIVIGLVDFTSDEITPILEDIGVVGDANISQVASYTFGNANIFIQSLPWVIGFGYVCALIFSIVFVISYETNPNPVFLGLYVMFIVLLIIGAIIMSNMYQDIYSGSDELGDRLREQTLLSYMILYSPIILAVIAIMSGIYIFARPQEASGGFGV